MVEFGDIWRIGGHVLACGDISLGHHTELLERAEALTNRTISLVYTDPPWNAGMAKSFRTQLEGKSDRKVDFKKLHDAITDPLPDVDVYIEAGRKHKDDMWPWFEAQGYEYREMWETRYAAGISYIFHICRDPTAVRIFNKTQPPAGYNNRILAAWGIERSTQPGELVYDPCMGLGGTALAAARLGRIALGLELVPKRVARSIAYLVGLTGQAPTKMGQLEAAP